jgi:DNA-binding NtrC family response regulator
LSTLFAMVDEADPYGPGLSGADAWAGPVLSTLGQRPFTRVVLLAGSGAEDRLASTAAEVSRRFSLPVECVTLPDGPPDQVRAFLSAWWQERCRTRSDEIRVGVVNAGPPRWRGWWWSLADQPASSLHLVEVTTPRYLTDEPARVNDVFSGVPSARDLVAREPAVSYRVETDPDVFARAWRGRDTGSAATPPPTLEQALAQLGLCGEHPAFRRAVETAATVAPHKAPVLLGGETGTGKGALARLIHVLSGRPQERWVTLNCAALPETLAESILFGHKRGAFTGAGTDQAGKFEVADRGTLFLDEVGELSLPLQAKLLKVLEDGMVEPLGARQGRAVDVRVVAATNRDLKAAVAGKTFREDLYYRLSFAELTLPPLRERRSDIPHLALHLVAKFCASLQTPRRLAPSALQRLADHDWPGNIRDLENVIGRSLLLASREELEAADLLMESSPAAADPLTALPTPREGFSLEHFLDDTRRQLILRALEQTGGKQSAAARLLGVTPQAIHRFLRDTKA